MRQFTIRPGGAKCNNKLIVLICCFSKGIEVLKAALEAAADTVGAKIGGQGQAPPAGNDSPDGWLQMITNGYADVDVCAISDKLKLLTTTRSDCVERTLA